MLKNFDILPNSRHTRIGVLIMVAREQVLRYKHLREKGLSEEDAVESLSFDKKDEDTNVSTKDLKIAFLEFAKEYNLDLINAKLNWVFVILTFMAGAFGGVFLMLFDISSRLPK